jgi:hypothetical protein
MTRRAGRIINAAVWLAIYVTVLVWTDAWRHIWVSVLIAFVPLVLGGYVHLVLRPGGTARSGPP